MPTIKKYPVFEDNQVLTAVQLNLLASYLDEQTRITRTYLIGTGIVCGLQVTMDEAQNKIIISKGTGVTSEGFLISMGQCETAYFRLYEFPTGVSYKHFLNAEGNLYTMYELLTTDKDAKGEALPNVEGLAEFPEDLWNDYVVVLFLEIYDKDLYSCLGKSCDEIGIERIFTVRKLLVSRDDLAAINARDVEGEISPNDQAYRYLGQFELKHLQMPRAILNTYTTKNTGQVIYQYMAPVALIFEELIENCSAAYDKFELLLSKSFNGNPVGAIESRIDDLRALLTDYLNGKSGFQYFYDFITDLVMAYNEFCCAASHLKNQCIPDEKTFPLHLMLGEIACPLSELRQHFVSSPIIGEQKEWNEKVTILYQRIIALLYAYDDDLAALTSEKGVLITPSREKGTRLGARAVPVYYNPDQNPDGYTLYDVWDEESCLPCRMEQDALPGYAAQTKMSMQEFPVSEAATPLYYDINNHAFLRIEGHVGMDEATARTAIKDIAHLYNLDFEIATLYVGLQGNIEKAKCVFSDLETDYAIWRNKMRFFLNNFIRLTKQAENLNGFIEAVKEEVDRIDNHMDESGDSDFRKSFPYQATLWMEAFSNFEPKEGEPPTSPDEEELMEHIRKLNQCLKGLIAAMPGDLEKLDFEHWCNAYRCVHNRLIAVMKRIAEKLNGELSPETRVQMMMVLFILHYFLEFLTFMLIRPYLTIATIHDTVVRRLEALKKEYSLSKTLDVSPGLEHMAGTYRGQTFVLLAQAATIEAGDDSKLFAGNAENPTVALQDLKETYEDLKVEGFYSDYALLNKGIIIGDLSGYVCCCDPCADIDVDNYNVSPIAFPVTRILAPERKIKDEKEGNPFYPVIKIQLLNNVYNPKAYEPDAGEAQFGEVSFEDSEYLPEDGKKNRILVYTPHTDKIRDAFASSKKYMLIDQIDYGFRSEDGLVSKEIIYIFICAISVMDIPEPESKTGKLTGTISADFGSAPFPPSVSELEFKIDGSVQQVDNNILTYESNTGVYLWKNISPGTHNIEVRFSGLSQSHTKQANIVAGEETKDVDFHFSEKTGPAEVKLGMLKGSIAMMVSGDTVSNPKIKSITVELDKPHSDFTFNSTGQFSLKTEAGTRIIKINVSDSGFGNFPQKMETIIIPEDNVIEKGFMITK